MRGNVVLVAFMAAMMTLGTAGAALIQEDFEAYPVGPGVPPGWFEGVHGTGEATWEITEVDGNKVLKAVSGAPGSGADASAGPDNETGWFVENMELQTAMCVVSGQGGGIAIGQFDGLNYVGNAYYVEIAIPENAIQLAQEGLSAGTIIVEYVDLPAGTLNYGEWYDVRLVSTGTAFQVWFRPHTTAPWQSTDKVIEVPHDLPHPGKKSYVDGYAGVWAQDGGAGPSTVLFDNFLLEAMAFPAPMDFTDDFEDASFTIENWSQHWCTADFFDDGTSQVVEVSATADRAGGMGIGLAKQYYTYNFVMGTSMFIDSSTNGGLVWGWEGTATEDTDYHLTVRTIYDHVRLELCENLNSVESFLAVYEEPMPHGSGWYNIEVVADYRWYYVYFWQRDTSRPQVPVIAAPQDVLHPGYRLMNAGAAGIWVNNYRVGYFDDFYFHGVERPSENTPEGTQVNVEPEPYLNMTFDAVTEGGSTSVEVSDTAPGGGPGGLEFMGTYYDINTTCVYDGPITICLTYDDTGMTLQEQENLRLMHWVTADQMWVDITVLPVDTVNNTVCGVTDSLSVFALAVLPHFEGFLKPINMPPQEISVFRQRSTVPVKFQLLNARTGQPVTDAEATIWGQLVSNDVPGEVNEELESRVPDVGIHFRYCEKEELYIYNLSTRNLMPGCVYRIHANIMNGLIDQWVDIALR